MRRLLLLAVLLGLAGLTAYRYRTIDRWEQTMGIGRHRDGDQPSSAPSS
jgi:hypothetical protein